MLSASGELVTPLADIQPRLPVNETNCLLQHEYLVHCLDLSDDSYTTYAVSKVSRLQDTRYPLLGEG